MEEQPIVKKAAQAFDLGHYKMALDLYKKASDVYGSTLFEANIALCKSRSSADTSEEDKTRQPPTLKEQIENTQQLLEYYFTRSQELEHQLLDK